MRIFALAACSAASLSLAACGGSSVGDLSEVDLPDQYASLEGLVTAAENGDLATASETMMSGTANLSGALAISDIGDDEELEAIGDLSLTADFTGGTVTGTADNFGLYDEDTQALEEELSGSLAISGTTAGTSLTADAIGTVNDGEDHSVDLDLSGTFYDYDGQLALYGDLEGTIDSETYEGGFGAIED
ncbi:hypothetical protein AQS8620_02411 [Aquimixticola soesokkakensis]|uniref:Transferrin-binding protein B C-lobe/N-lobe beta barrel domain-containing protein n=1 Tax=Aquimixticola soesokkakensis TaxID=1519096 RepID=A0A1Y5T491_9RHOB|nr:hypothetical protein [Aquimixticola soesokkakensis]SLN55011.1 hypothetical protein AQS8620_02411 [Aquimixticola soesokkakensis]